MTRSTTRMQQISTSIYRKYKLSVLYASLTIPVGIILIFFDKAPSRNDFLDHWNRAEQIAAGQFTAIPDPSGTGNYGAINKDGVFEAFNNTAINSPFTYFPSVFGGGHLRISCLLTLLFSTLFVCIAISLAKAVRHDYIRNRNSSDFLSFLYIPNGRCHHKFNFTIMGCFHFISLPAREIIMA